MAILTALVLAIRSYAQIGLSAAVALSAGLISGPVNVSGWDTTHPVPVGYFGANIVNSINREHFPEWGDPVTAHWLADLDITGLRFPGGAVGNYWNWQNGTKCAWDATTTDTMANFAALAESLGAAPSYVVNVLSSTSPKGCLIDSAPAEEPAMIQNTLAMLSASDNAGLTGEKYIELGNEFYLPQDDYVTRFPCTEPDCVPGDVDEADDNAGAVYGADANTWISALRDAYPDAKIGAVAYAHADGHARTINWDTGLLGTLSGADALIFHNYTAVTSASTSPEAILASFFDDWSTLESIITDMKSAGISQAWITEWNFSDKTDAQVFAGTWLSALVDAEHLIHYLSEPAITRELVWNLANVDGGTSLVYYPDRTYMIGGTDYIVPDGNGVLSATGDALEQFGTALLGAGTAAGVNLTRVPMITGKNFNSYPAVSAVRLTAASTTEYVFVNVSGNTQNVHVGEARGNATMESIYAPTLMTYITPNTPPSTKSGTVLNSTVALPAYSITIVTITTKEETVHGTTQNQAMHPVRGGSGPTLSGANSGL